MATPAPPHAADNAAQDHYWNELAAPAWVAQQEALDIQIGPLGEAAIAALAPRPGERILDIGCGCGASALALARAVGPAGAVLGVDLSTPMLDVARRRAAGVAHLEFRRQDAQSGDLGADHDAAYSRFGVMFFADPARAFRHIGGALRAGGRLGFVCWRAASENPWMTAPLAAANAVLPPEEAAPEDPASPGPFAFADPARITAILRAAGFSRIAVTAHDARIGGLDTARAVELALTIGPLGRRLREAPQARDAARAAVSRLLEAHDPGDGARLAAGVWIVTATWRDSSDRPG